jgi:hypothetical protein
VLTFTMLSSLHSRHKFIMQNLTRHLHEFVKETEFVHLSPFHPHVFDLPDSITTEEWMTAIQFLTATGQNCTPMYAHLLEEASI